MTDRRSRELEDARQALARHAWTDAYAVLSSLSGSADDPDCLELLGEAAWWVGRLDECIGARERLYRLSEHADRRRAARAALLLHDNHMFKGQRAVAGAWLARGRRLLEEEPESLEHCVLLLRDAELAHSEGRLEEALAFARRALDVGRRLGDSDLEAESLQCVGRILIVEGKPREGLALYDEAMLAAVEGRVGPFVAGKVYCSLISACEELSDFRRAAEWTEVGSMWAASHPFSVFPGLCRVHRAEVLQLRGEWVQAEKEARQACSELAGINLLERWSKRHDG